MCDRIKRALGRVYLSSSRCIYENLAFEEYLFRRHDVERDGDAMLIWSNKPAVVIGRHQNPWSEVNLPFLRKSGIDLARRHSGGGTVYHDMGNINISFLTSHKSHCRPRNLQFLADTINGSFKVNVVPNKRDDMDLQPGSRKCSGTAARISRGKAYHHLTLLVEADLNRLSKSLASPYTEFIKSNATPSVRASAVGFLKQDDKSIDVSTVKKKIIDMFTTLFQSCPVEEINVLSEMSENEEIAKNYYDLVCFDWVFGKTPKFNYRNEEICVLIEKGYVKESNSRKYNIGQRLPLRNIHISTGRFQATSYYDTLGVKKEATQREIKSAYYQLSKKFHPDVAGKSASAAAKFLEVSEAYDCLRDPQKRRAYDNQMSGGGGRYTGDYSDPFQSYQQHFRQRQQWPGENPFYNKQFTQAEYERIWNEFNRVRNERRTYDQQMEYERQRLWMEFAKRRAERWQAFHQRYPEGPPGSIKWEFRFGHSDGNQQRRVYQGWELVRRIAIIYFVCFIIVSFFQVIYHSVSPPPRRDYKADDEPLEKDKIEAMITRQPPSQTSYMYSQLSDRYQPTEAHPSVPSETPYYPTGGEYSYNDDNSSQYSTYRLPEK